MFCTNDVGSLQVTDEPSNLFTVRSDGSKLSQITDYGPGKERASQPTWTADGRIIFDHITGANDELGTVAFINSDGSGLEIAVGNEFIGGSNRPHPRLRPSSAERAGLDDCCRGSRRGLPRFAQGEALSERG